MSDVAIFPDPETMLMYALVPLNPDMRFVTILPSGDPDKITVRIRRTGGFNANIAIDRPTVDIDVFGLKSQTGNVSAAARLIQSQILSLMSAVLPNGVVQHATTVSGPRQLWEVNPRFVRYSATYELKIRS
jgi:hypothetical protein